MPCTSTRSIALRLDAAERSLGILQIINESKAAPVVGLAVESGAHVPRGTLQQLYAEAGLELFDGVGHGRARQTEILGGSGEAAPLHDAGEHSHCVEAVHGFVRYFRIVMPNNAMIIRRLKRRISSSSDADIPHA